MEKEREIQNFKPVESWKIKAILDFSGSIFQAELSKIDGKTVKITSSDQAQKILSTLIDDIKSLKETKTKKDTKEFSKDIQLDFELANIVKKDSKRNPGAPFTTSTLQQEAARKFGFGVKQTMSVAQKLYEGMDLGAGERQGLITYMRTDSVNLSDTARESAKEVILKDF